jgi:hypothetical protein
MALPYLYNELDHPVFTSLDFAIKISCYKNKVVCLAFNPNLEGQGSVFMIPSDRVLQ